jgi:hypothetical protein
MVYGSYNESKSEYQPVVEIPAGSTSIFISQTPLYARGNVSAGDDIHLGSYSNRIFSKLISFKNLC